MKVKLTINRLFVYSEVNNKYFYTEFDDDINIIYGKNTSGKSTVFHSILYTIGINDNNDYLQEILDEEIFFRIDCKIENSGISEKVVFIRDGETIFFKSENWPILRFNGINADHSAEHVKLKDYMHELFGFSLKLESKNEYKPAPIETMFLPYYLSQAVSWVYIRKSFSNLDFYKNFKDDYLDYYLGIETLVDRRKKQELELELKSKEEEIRFYTKLEKNNDEFQITKLMDEQFIEESKEYIESHKDNKKQLNSNEEEYISKCNDQSYYQRRLSLLRKISRNHNSQNPTDGVCPTCNQTLPYSLDASYKYFQEENDTKEEIKKCKEKIKKLQSDINSLKKNMENQKLNISKEYGILRNYFNNDISFDSWMKNKINTRLISDIIYKLGKLTTDKEEIAEKLKTFKTDAEVEQYRLAKSKDFASIFSGFLAYLGGVLATTPPKF